MKKTVVILVTFLAVLCMAITGCKRREPEDSPVTQSPTQTSGHIENVELGFRLIYTLRGQSTRIRAVAFSPDSRLLAFNGEGMIKIWDIAVNHCLQTIESSRSIPIAFFFPSDGERLISVCDEGIMRIWDLKSGRLLKTFGGEWTQDSESMSACLSPNGRQVILGGTPALQIYDLDLGRRTDVIVGHTENVRSVASSPDGKFLVSASDDTLLKVWQRARIQDDIKEIVLSTNAVAIPIWMQNCWDGVKTIEYSPDLTEYDRCQSVAFSSDGNHIVSVSAREVQVWNIAGPHRVMNFQPDCKITAAALSPRNKTIVLGTCGEIALYDWATGHCLEILGGREDENVESLTFSPDGSMIASVHGGDTINIWVTKKGNINTSRNSFRTFSAESGEELDRQHSSSNHDTLFPAENRQMMGFIDRSGKFVFSWLVDYVTWCRPLRSEGMGLISLQGMNNVATIDSSGKVLGQANLGIGAFSEGLAPAKKAGGKWGYVDKTLRFVIEPRFLAAEGFREGLAAIKEDLSSPYGYIDKEGKTVIPPLFYYAGPFFESLAVAVREGDEAPAYGYINKSGNFVIEPQFVWCGDFSEGIGAAVSLVRERGRTVQKWGYINKSGKAIIGFQFEEAAAFSEGLAAIKVDGKWGYIDRTGNMVIAPRFEEASGFSEGVGKVKIGGKYGYIDSTGRIVLEASLAKATEFHEGAAYIEADHSRGYIDRNGKYFWKYAVMIESSVKIVEEREIQGNTITNLRRIGRSLWMYAEDHNGKFPGNLQELITEAKLELDALEPPGKSKGFDGPGYIYISGQIAELDPGNILVYENPEFSSKEINVLYLDGHVSTIEPSDFLNDLEATYKRLGRQMANIKLKPSPE